MFFSDGMHKVTVPRQNEIRPGLLLEIIGEMGLTKEQFLELLETI
jgi:hypothetical protein